MCVVTAPPGHSFGRGRRLRSPWLAHVPLRSYDNPYHTVRGSEAPKTAPNRDSPTGPGLWAHTAVAHGPHVRSQAHHMLTPHSRATRHPRITTRRPPRRPRAASSAPSSGAKGRFSAPRARRPRRPGRPFGCAPAASAWAVGAVGRPRTPSRAAAAHARAWRAWAVGISSPGPTANLSPPWDSNVSQSRIGEADRDHETHRKRARRESSTKFRREIAAAVGRLSRATARAATAELSTTRFTSSAPRS